MHDEVKTVFYVSREFCIISTSVATQPRQIVYELK
jgi:hypothetical protein